MEKSVHISDWTTERRKHNRNEEEICNFDFEKVTIGQVRDRNIERNENRKKKQEKLYLSTSESNISSDFIQDTKHLAEGDHKHQIYAALNTHDKLKTLLACQNPDRKDEENEKWTVKKIMIAVFFKSSEIVKRVVLDTQKTVTAKWYTEQCLPKVIQSINDFALFPHVKMKLKGKRFSSDEDLLQAWDNECASLPDETWQSWFKNWFRRMEKCIKCGGNYFKRI
ncbi:hypothetical protein ILUMI_19311 [Ignelater luminosus]|uniref:Uncharacterized protein n=1 Tax=Ignelater luminosus TaxID=2038154 RepID=A0A8K0G5Q2_IGNLU|nr:hypothetical protein ILUMI_19311 [Ignelater luminosus]